MPTREKPQQLGGSVFLENLFFGKKTSKSKYTGITDAYNKQRKGIFSRNLTNENLPDILEESEFIPVYKPCPNPEHK